MASWTLNFKCASKITYETAITAKRWWMEPGMLCISWPMNGPSNSLRGSPSGYNRALKNSVNSLQPSALKNGPWFLTKS